MNIKYDTSLKLKILRFQNYNKYSTFYITNRFIFVFIIHGIYQYID
jgi:hypothetical protein